MQYTISDFLATYGNAVRLLAGGGGLSRSVNEVGILDYELAPGVKASYLRSNFTRASSCSPRFCTRATSPTS